MWNQNSNGFYLKSAFFQGCTLQKINILRNFKWNYRLCSHVLAGQQIQVFAYVISRKRRANQRKKIQWCFSTEMKATCKNSANLEQETKTTKIVTYPLLSLASSFVVCIFELDLPVLTVDITAFSLRIEAHVTCQYKSFKQELLTLLTLLKITAIQEIFKEANCRRGKRQSVSLSCVCSSFFVWYYFYLQSESHLCRQTCRISCLELC